MNQLMQHSTHRAVSPLNMLAILSSISFPALLLMSCVTLSKLFKSGFQLSLNERVEVDSQT